MNVALESGHQPQIKSGRPLPGCPVRRRRFLGPLRLPLKMRLRLCLGDEAWCHLEPFAPTSGGLALGTLHLNVASCSLLTMLPALQPVVLRVGEDAKRHCAVLGCVRPFDVPSFPALNRETLWLCVCGGSEESLPPKRPPKLEHLASPPARLARSFWKLEKPHVVFASSHCPAGPLL